MDAMNKLVRMASELDKTYERLVMLCRDLNSDSLYREAKKCFDDLDDVLAKMAGAAFNHDRFYKT